MSPPLSQISALLLSQQIPMLASPSSRHTPKPLGTLARRSSSPRRYSNSHHARLPSKAPSARAVILGVTGYTITTRTSLSCFDSSPRIHSHQRPTEWRKLSAKLQLSCEPHKLRLPTGLCIKLLYGIPSRVLWKLAALS